MGFLKRGKTRVGYTVNQEAKSLADMLCVPDYEVLHTIETASNVEVLSQAEKLAVELQHHFNNGRPTWDANEEALMLGKAELLAMLLEEVRLRYHKDDPHRMHLTEK